MKITTKGQVTIPVHVRERLGLLPNTEVEIEVEGDRAVLRKQPRSRRRGAKVVDHLRGRGDVALSTDAIMALTRPG